MMSTTESHSEEQDGLIDNPLSSPLDESHDTTPSDSDNSLLGQRSNSSNSSSLNLISSSNHCQPHDDLSTSTPTLAAHSSSSSHEHVPLAATPFNLDHFSADTLFMNDPIAHKKLLDKVTLYLLPFLSVLYLLSYIDRSNLSNVHTLLKKDLNLTEDQYGFSASIFFIPYVILEVPSNMVLERVDARKWLTRIIVTWGLFSTCMCFITGYSGLVFLRFSLGLAEAGLFPGVIYYLTLWYTPKERAERLAYIYLAQPASGILGSLISYAVLESMDGMGGIRNWRWLFIIEGLPTIIMGIVTWFYLPSSPAEATFLTPAEKDFLMQRLMLLSDHVGPVVKKQQEEYRRQRLKERANSTTSNGSTVQQEENQSEHETDTNPPNLHHYGSNDHMANKYSSTDLPSMTVASTNNAHSENTSSHQFRHVTSLSYKLRLFYRQSRTEFLSLWHSTLKSLVLVNCCIVNFLCLLPVVAVTFYLPAITSELGLGPLAGNLLSAIPYTIASVYMLANAFHSDRSGGERYLHSISSNIIGFIGLLLSAITLSSSGSSMVYLQLASLCVAAAGIWGTKPPLMAWFSSCVKGNVAVSIAVITTMGNISGIVAPLIMSALRGDSDNGNYASGCLFLMACLMFASVCVHLLHTQTKSIMDQKKKTKQDTQQLMRSNSHSSNLSDNSTSEFYHQTEKSEEVAEAELELEMGAV